MLSVSNEMQLLKTNRLITTFFDEKRLAIKSQAPNEEKVKKYAALDKQHTNAVEKATRATERASQQSRS